MNNTSKLWALLLVIAPYVTFAQCQQNVGGQLSVYSEYPVTSGGETPIIAFDDQLRLVQLAQGNYRVCSDRLDILFEPSDTPNFYASTTVTTTSGGDIKDNMCYYHLDQAWDYLDALWVDNPLVGHSSIEFKPTFQGTGVENIPQIQVNASMVEFSASATGVYAPLGEDAYAVVNGFFQFVHRKAASNKPALLEGVNIGIASYLAHRYMVDKGFADNDIIFEHGGTGADSRKWKSLNMTIGGIYESGISSISAYYRENLFRFELKEQVQSELLSASLWEIGLAIGNIKVDDLLKNTLSSMLDDPLENEGIRSQVDAAVLLYSEAVSLGYSDDDKCTMIDIFNEVYGTLFYQKLDASDVPTTYGSGDLLIRDTASDSGLESNTVTGGVYNSIDIWNRKELDEGLSHQSPTASAGSTPNTDFLHVRINASYCELASLIGFRELDLTVYINNRLNNNSTWSSSYTGPAGGVVGNYDFKTGTFTDGNGQVVSGQLYDYFDHVVLAFPWEVPDSRFFLKNFVYHRSFEFLAILDNDSAEPTFDPITYPSTDIFAPLYAKQNNNVSLKRSTILSPAAIATCCHVPTSSPVPGTGTGPYIGDPIHGIIVPGGGSGGDPDVVVTLDPSVPTISGPDDVLPPGSDPIDLVTGEESIVEPEIGENYWDYGTAAIVLDEDLLTLWESNGALGSGFVQNTDGVIMVTDPATFYLAGVPRSTANDTRVISVFFIADSDFVPVAFDLSIRSSDETELLDFMHFEVWDEESARGKSSSSENVSGRSVRNGNKATTTVYPNPIDANILSVSMTGSKISAVEMMDLSGRLVLKQVVDPSDVMQVDVSAIERGMLLLKITDSSGEVTIKKVLKL